MLESVFTRVYWNRTIHCLKWLGVFCGLSLTQVGLSESITQAEKDTFTCPNVVNGKNNSGRTPAIPYKNPGKSYQKKWQRQVSNIKKGTKILLLGDSHIELWPDRLLTTIFKESYAKLGISNETVEELNWRVNRPEIWEKIQPELVILLSGINNAGRNSDLEITEGLIKVMERIKTVASVKNIVAFTLFPAGRKGRTGYRRQIKCVNSKLVAKTRKDSKIKIFTVYKDLLQPKTLALTEQLSKDGLHFNHKGYKKITDRLKQFLLHAKII